MTVITTYVSILAMIVNGLKSPIKRHSLANWIKREDMKIWFLKETCLIDRNKHRIRVEEDLPS
jgi:hypothetical protein